MPPHCRHGAEPHCCAIVYLKFGRDRTRYSVSEDHSSIPLHLVCWDCESTAYFFVPAMSPEMRLLRLLTLRPHRITAVKNCCSTARCRVMQVCACTRPVTLVAQCGWATRTNNTSWLSSVMGMPSVSSTNLPVHRSLPFCAPCRPSLARLRRNG